MSADATHQNEGATPGSQRTRQVPAVTRAISILRLLGRSDEPLGVNQIARELDLIPSTCLHILRVLVEEDLAEFDPDTKRYTIGIGVLPIARNVIRKNAFHTVVQPYLDTLSTQFGLTAIGVQLHDLDHMVVVAISRTSMPFRLQVDIGSRFPSLISATGRCFAAFGGYPQRDLARRFKALKWDNPPDFEQWQQEVETTRTTGYGVDENTYIAGVTVVSVPILNEAGAMVHGIVAVGVTEKVKSMGIDAIAAEMLSAKDEVAAQLYL